MNFQCLRIFNRFFEAKKLFESFNQIKKILKNLKKNCLIYLKKTD